MTDCTFDIEGVSEAKGWANQLIAANHRGPGDTTDAAIHRAAVKHGLDPKLLWRLRYRTPKSMLIGAWKRIKSAYDAECGRQEARLRHELEITKALPETPARLALIAETEALLAAMDSEAEGRSAERAD
jgi:hypothetical protein